MVVPYRMAGNAQKMNLTGPDQLLLSIYLFVYPGATNDELATFVCANSGGTYLRQEISRRCSELDVTRKNQVKRPNIPLLLNPSRNWIGLLVSHHPLEFQDCQSINQLI